jgi:hypothetical protein
MWRGFFTTKRRARWSHRIIGGGGGGFGGLGGGGFGGLKYMRLIPLPNHEPLALLVIQIVKFWTASAHTTGRALNKRLTGILIAVRNQNYRVLWTRFEPSGLRARTPAASHARPY